MVLSWAKKIFLTTLDMYLPALLFAMCVFFYCNKAVSYTVEPAVLHAMFYGLLACLFFTLLITKKNKEIFLVLQWLVLYVGLNVLKKNFGVNFVKTDYYAVIGLLVSLNWLTYLVLDYLKVKSKYYLYLVGALFVEGALIENSLLVRADGFNEILFFAAIAITLISVLAYIFYVSIVSGVKNYGLFFSYLCLCMGFYNSESEFALSLCFSVSVLIFLVAFIYSEVYAYFKDPLTSVYSAKTYLRQSQKFPLKYSLGIVCVDDYSKLLKVFGKRKVDVLVKMVVEKMKQFATDANIYRISEDEFILIFNNEDKKKSYEYLENVRRSIAGSEFVLSSSRIVKVTVSSCITEKKRSDADAEAVMIRAREAFQRTYKFTQNMTTMA